MSKISLWGLGRAGLLALALAACSSGAGGGSTGGGGSDASTGGGGSGGGGAGGVPTDGGLHAFSWHPGDSWEGETHVAVGTNGHVAAVWIASSDPDWESSPPVTSYIGARFSRDSGATWTPVQAIRAPAPDDVYSADPAVAVDAADNFYLVFMGAGTVGRQNEHRTGIWVAKAPAGTTAFGDPVEVTDPADSAPSEAGPAVYWFDKPWIAVTHDQEIVVTYAQLDWAGCPPGGTWTACESNIMLSRSTDAKSWTRTQVTANAAGSGSDGGALDRVNYASPCASTTSNRLWVVYNTYSNSTNAIGITVQFSDDDGATFSPPEGVAQVTAAGFHDPPSCVGTGDDVWVAYELTSPIKALATSIQVAHSTDGGMTFGTPVNALDTQTSAFALHAVLALESAGQLDVVYYGGATVRDPDAGVYYVRSVDHGSTWGRAELLAKPVTLVNNRKIDWLGDYLGVAVADGSLYTTFTDNSSGTAQVDFVKTELP